LERSSRRTAVTVFVLAAMAVIVTPILVPASVASRSQGDYVSYYRPVADRLLAGHGLAHGAPDGGPALRYPPGEPLLVAATLRVSRAIGLSDGVGQRLVTMLLMGAACVLVWAIARRTFGDAPALVTAALFIVYPANRFVAMRLNSEVPFMVLVFGSTLLVVSAAERSAGRSIAWRSAAAGALLGVALLVRPIGVAFVVPMLLVIGVPRRVDRASVARAALFLGALLVVVGPWILWASGQGQGFVPLSTGGRPSVIDGLSYGLPGREPGRSWVPGPARSAMSDAAARAAAPRPPSVPSLVGSVARHHPLGFAELVGLKAARAWYGTESERSEWLVALVQAPFLGLTAWGALLALGEGARTRGRGLAMLLLGILLATWILTVCVLSIAAYLAPVIALGFALAGVGPARCWAARAGRSRRGPAPAAAPAPR